jgi:hypothetical protein
MLLCSYPIIIYIIRQKWNCVYLVVFLLDCELLKLNNQVSLSTNL